jgi:hypothetical protein
MANPLYEYKQHQYSLQQKLLSHIEEYNEFGIRNCLDIILKSIQQTDEMTSRIPFLIKDLELHKKTWQTLTKYDKMLERALQISKSKNNFCYDVIVEYINNIEKNERNQPINIPQFLFLIQQKTCHSKKF